MVGYGSDTSQTTAYGNWAVVFANGANTSKKNVYTNGTEIKKNIFFGNCGHISRYTESGNILQESGHISRKA